jgi:hypothetical protein
LEIDGTISTVHPKPADFFNQNNHPMTNDKAFIEHILNTTQDELLLKFWRQQLAQQPVLNEDGLTVAVEKQEAGLTEAALMTT